MLLQKVLKLTSIEYKNLFNTIRGCKNLFGSIKGHKSLFEHKGVFCSFNLKLT